MYSVVNYSAGGSLLYLEISRNVIVMEIIGKIIFCLQFHENLVYMVSVDKKGNLNHCRKILLLVLLRGICSRILLVSKKFC